MEANVAAQPYPESDAPGTPGWDLNGAVAIRPSQDIPASRVAPLVENRGLVGATPGSRSAGATPLRPSGLFDYLTWDQAKRARTLRFRSEGPRRG